MQIRTFTAPKLHLALALVRKEFGPEAMILDRNRNTDEDGNLVWQVRAARDGDEASQRKEKPRAAPVIQTSAQPDFDHRLQHSMQHLECLIGGLGRRETDTLRSTLQDEAERRGFDTLLACGVSPTYAHDLASGMARHAEARATCMHWGKRLRPQEQRENVLITGPCGGGKTTMIANLATHFHMQGINVALVSTDTERMGGIESLAAYASVLGIELHALRKAEEAKEILHKTESARLLLIDSEGWSQANRKNCRRQTPLWQALAPNRRMLLLPANLDEADGMATLEAAAGLHLTDLLPGKLDETSATGKVVNWAARSRLPLSYCSFGSCVPDQMGWLNPRTLATLLQRNHGKESA
ncbi:MAG: GTP-binding protein [Mariprofundaceae bacterium]|nr:GTP-binding protein [Mariprofundaceae bacterium]